MAEKITKNTPNDSFLGENGSFPPKTPENSSFSDTPSKKPTILEVESLQNPVSVPESPSNQEKSPQIEQNKDFFDQLTTFLKDFLAKQGIASQNEQFSSILKENQPQSVDFDPKSVENIENKGLSPLKPNEFNDYEAFLNKYPNITMQELEKDQSFMLFLQGREKTASIEEIYKNYNTLRQFIEKEAVEGYLARQAQIKSSVGELSSPSKADQGFFTREQVLRMSREQISRNYDKIRKSQQSW